MKISLTVLGLIGMSYLVSCVSPAAEEIFPPNAAANCTDGILNQGEYNIDCGGPCAPCAVGDPVLSVIVDSTWFEDSVKTAGRIFSADKKSLSLSSTREAGYLWVTAVSRYPFPDTNRMHTVIFRIPTTVNRGVHEISETDPGEYYRSDPLSGNYTGELVRFENGVITITNKDSINGYISGKFEYICEADRNFYRTVLIDGEFTDFPYK